MIEERRLLESCFRPAHISEISESIDIETIMRAKEMRYIVPVTLDGRVFQITDQGRKRLETLLESEQRAKEKSEDAANQEAQKIANDAKADKDRKKQFRHDWAITVFSTIGGAIFGAILDHLFDIVGNCARFFASLFP